MIVLHTGALIRVENIDLAWEHRDPADRTIVALATRTEGPLVTSARAIREFYTPAV